jgi:threonine/homoserine/homoserine lactone efflux protein
MFADPLFAAFLSFTLLFVATPGSTTAVVVRNTIDGGRRAGIWAAAGAAVANATHATVAGLGAGVLVARWPAAIDVVRVVGGGYLAWLGLRGLWEVCAGHALQVDVPAAAPTSVHHRSLREGLAVNILNPVILTFYLAAVPTFLRPSWPRFAYVTLAACHVAMAFVCHSAWALGFDRVRHVLQRRGPRRVLGLATSVALLLLAFRVLTR